MKTALIYWFTFLFILLAISCKTVLPVETKSDYTKNVNSETTTSKQKEVSKAIIDSLMIKINAIKTAKPECDSITNLEIQKLLKMISSIKKSGDNQTGFYFDEIRQMLVAYAKTGQSSNEKIEETKNTDSTETSSKETPIIVPTPIPAFIKYLAALGFGLILFLIGYIGFIIYKRNFTIVKKILN